MTSSTSISIAQFGAVGDGVSDNTSALQQAFDYAAANKLSVYIPPGTYSHSGVVYAKGVAVTGAGSKSVLLASDPGNAAIYLQGSNASLSNLEVTTVSSGRYGSIQSAGVVVDHASNFVIQDVTVEKAGSVGIFMDSSSGGKVLNNTVADTRADGISVTNAVGYGQADGTDSSNITIQGNLIERSGDDSISEVSYVNSAGAENNNIHITGNTVMENDAGRNVAIAGGQNIYVTANNLQQGSSNNAGIQLLADGGFGTYGDSGVTVNNNTIKYSGPAGGIFVYNGNSPSSAAAFLNTNLSITGNSIYNPVADGIRLYGGAANQDLTITNNNVYNPGSGLAVNDDGAQQVTNTNNAVLPDSAYSGDLVPTVGGSGMPLPPVSQHVITLTVDGDQFQGVDPILRVTVDGEQIASDTPVTAIHSAGTWEAITIQPFLLASSSQLGLELVNDPGDPAPGYGNPVAGESNAIYIQQITIDGKAITSGQITLNNSNFTYVPIPQTTSAPDTLVLDVSEDAYQGDAQFVVSVNGVQIGGIQTATASHSAGQDTAVTLNGSYGADPTVVVTFTNDLYLGPGEDRNLYVDGMTYDGIAQTASDTLLADGSAAFALHGSVTAAIPKATLALGDDTGATASLGVISSGSQVTLGGSQIALDGNIRQSIDSTGVANISTDTFGSGVISVATKDTGGASYHFSNFLSTNVELGGAPAHSMATAGSLTIDGAAGGNIKLDAGNYNVAIAARGDAGGTAAQNQFNITLGNTGNQNELHVDDSGTQGISTNVIHAGSGVDQMWFIGAKSTTVYGGSGTAAAICNSGANSFIDGSGTLIVVGGPGADSYTFHAGDGLLKIYDFNLSRGDTLTADKALSGAMTEASDGRGGLMISFGTAGHGVDLVGVSSLTSGQIHYT